MGIAKNRQLTPRIALWQHRAMFAMFVFGEPERHFSLTLTPLGCGGSLLRSGQSPALRSVQAGAQIVISYQFFCSRLG